MVGLIDTEKKLGVSSLECFQVPRKEGVGQVQVLGPVALGGDKTGDGIDKNFAKVQA